MTGPVIGSLFSGYGGLELGIIAALGGRVAWHCEWEPAPSKILEHHWPGIPNYGDVTTLPWDDVEPVDILCGGFPCQDLSGAGKRLGLRPGTRSGMWLHFAYGIERLRPRMVIIENVRGLLSAEAHSDVEPCPWCVGDKPGGGLRALGAVLGDLADLGYDARWYGLRAADVGAPHGRFRVFVVASPADSQRGGWLGRQVQLGGLPGQPAGDLRTAVSLLPTPAVNDMGEGKTPEVWDEWTAKMQAAHGNGNGHGKSLAIEAQRLLPTPTTQDGANNGGPSQQERNTIPLNAIQDWGIYAAAITRWEALTCPAPTPTQPSKKGTPQLSPRFSEWMMGLPEGWVTDVPGLTRNDQLKALGNGVVPQQAEAAIRWLLAPVAGE